MSSVHAGRRLEEAEQDAEEAEEEDEDVLDICAKAWTDAVDPIADIFMNFRWHLIINYSHSRL